MPFTAASCMISSASPSRESKASWIRDRNWIEGLAVGRDGVVIGRRGGEGGGEVDVEEDKGVEEEREEERGAKKGAKKEEENGEAIDNNEAEELERKKAEWRRGVHSRREARQIAPQHRIFGEAERGATFRGNEEGEERNDDDDSETEVADDAVMLLGLAFITMSSSLLLPIFFVTLLLLLLLLSLLLPSSLLPRLSSSEDAGWTAPCFTSPPPPSLFSPFPSIASPPSLTSSATHPSSR
mmetsp:Transcript_26040/g.47608  ORF Transcript_26040/g.47608 Transcript_26040/m.47608 type:complete len:240 (-) Transcript_26040:6989-7708(-)